nr:helix-turn-helix transcriptional regulator [Oceanobacillus sojae]
MKNNLKVARIQVDLTQQQLAEKTGVTRQTISLIEKGNYNPTLNLCLEICYAVNKTLDEVFWRGKE